MNYQTSEQMYYEQETIAINTPSQYLASPPEPYKQLPTSSYIISINTIKAQIVMGQFDAAMLRLNQLQKELQQCKDSFVLGQFYLLQYKLFSFSNPRSEESLEALKQAESHALQSGSAALEGEFLLIRTCQEIQEKDVSESEEIFHGIMTTVTKTGYPELILDVYLGYILLYMNNDLPEQANRELLMIRDMIDPNDHPLKFVSLKNMEGVVKSSLSLKTEAQQSLQEAIAIARKKAYLVQLVRSYINLGVINIGNNEYEAAINMYDAGLKILSVNQNFYTELESSLINNKARALTLLGQSDQAIALMQNAITRIQPGSNDTYLNILLVNLANAQINVDQFESALENLELAGRYFEGKKLYDMLQRTLLTKARLFEVQEDYKAAFEAMEEQFQASRAFFQDNFSKRSNTYKQRIEELRKQYFLLKSKCSQNDFPAPRKPEAELIGEHPLIKKALDNAILAAKHPFVNVHVYGESGTGKEIIAQIIHEASNSGKRMVAINSSAISPNLIESELFGHVKGSFTGAINDHKGKFQQADGGTLFLDEVSEMPLDCQAKLLRALEHQSILPVGGSKEIKVKCRIISASNKRLSELIRKNSFRLDLYHRLNKVEIYLPPLRERKDDIVHLTRHFVKRFAIEFGSPVPQLEESFFNRLRQHSFPGNVRELMNIIERIFILKPKLVWDQDQLDGLIEEPHSPESTGYSIAHNLELKEINLIQDTLARVNWVQKEAAKILGITESTLSRRIKKYQITR